MRHLLLVFLLPVVVSFAVARAQAPTCIAPAAAAAAAAACAGEDTCRADDGLIFLRAGAARLIVYGAAALAPVDAPAAESAPPTLTVRNPSGVPLNLRSAPGTFGAVIATLAGGGALTASGRSPDGAWLFVPLADGRPAWIAASVAAVEGDPLTLFVVEDAEQFSVAPPVIPAFTLELGAGCGGLLLHAGEPARLRVNDAEIALESGALALTADTIAVIDGAPQIAYQGAMATYAAGDLLTLTALGVAVSALADAPTDAPLAALPESVALCLAPDGSTPAACGAPAAPALVEGGMSAAPTQAAPLMSAAPAHASFAHVHLPPAQSVWQAYTGADYLSGACETPPIAACDHLSAVQVNPDGTIGWRGQEPVYYPMTPVGVDHFAFRGRNSLNTASITLEVLFSAGAWSGTMQYVFDHDPDCTHTFYYTASRLR